MSSQSSEKSLSRDIESDDLGEGQPIKVKFSLSGLMNNTSTNRDLSGGMGGGIGIGIGIGSIGISGGIGGIGGSLPPSIEQRAQLPQETSIPFEGPIRDNPPPMRGISYNDVDMEDGEDSMETASASASVSVSITLNNRNDAQDPDSNTETESNFNKADEDMDGSMSIADDDKSQEDKDHPTQTRATHSSSIDDQTLPTGGGGVVSGGMSSNVTGEHLSNANIAGGSSKKKDENSSQENEMSSRSATAAAERELLGFREPAVAVTTPTISFLDSLSEEQRRVRTRHLPDVSGFRRLHKSEIKRDLALVRKLLKAGSSSSLSSTVAKGTTKKSDEDIDKDLDVEKMITDGNGLSEDDSQHSPDDEVPVVRTKSGRGHMDDLDLTKILENPNLANTFSLPYTESPYICTDVEGKSANAHPSLFSSPQVVESITAFNPPRPPESVGPKKIHRLNRWERRPQDVEIDLRNYRKTVDRTRQELHKAENENYKVEVVGQHLRAHFMSQSQLMRYEVDLLNETYDSIRTQCVKGAELLTSKTRSRGTAKGANVMKDVLAVLKARKERDGSDNNQDLTIAHDGESWCSSGVGGINSNKASAPQLASGWLLPGEKVSSPCGVGTVVHTFGPTILDVNKEMPSSLKTSSQREPPQSQLPSSIKDKKGGSTIILPPRVCVKLPFGLGYFSPSELKSLENIAAYNDEQLSDRWMSMIKVSETMGTSIDSAAVDNHDLCHSTVLSSPSNAGDMVNASIVQDSVMVDAESNQKVEGKGKLLPYGSSLLPSSSHRGGGLENMPLEDLEENVGKMLDKSTGVLGAYDNPNVPDEYKQWELSREKLRRLQGKVMQLRNKVYRQKRIRYLNERNLTSGEDRRRRFEFLLSDMKSDLDSLKGRLKEELNELGIDQVKAAQLLTDYYTPEEVDLDYIDGKRKAEEEFEKSSRRRLDMGTPPCSSSPSEQ